MNSKTSFLKFFFSFCAVIHLPSIIIIHCLCLPAIVHHYFSLLGCFVISVFSYTHYIYLHEVDISFSFFSFPLPTVFFFFFYLLQSELHSTHTKLNLRLHRIASFFDKYMINFKFRWSFFFVHTHTEPETWYLACNNSSCHEFIYIDNAVILVICQWLSWISATSPQR